MARRPHRLGFVGSGLVAGAAFLTVELTLLPPTKHVPVDWILRLAASLVSGPSALRASSALNGFLFAQALGMHAMLSLAFGYVLCRIDDAIPFGRALVANTAFGIGLYLFNFYVMTRELPWFATARGGATLLAHVLFAVTTVLMRKGLALRRAAPTHA